MHSEPTLALAAAKAGMDEKTARKYRRAGKLPSEVQKAYDASNREDAFADLWDELQKKLEINPGPQA